MTAQLNLSLLPEMEANRRLILMACPQNPGLPDLAQPRIEQLFDMAPWCKSREVDGLVRPDADSALRVAKQGAIELQSLLPPLAAANAVIFPNSLTGSTVNIEENRKMNGLLSWGKRGL